MKKSMYTKCDFKNLRGIFMIYFNLNNPLKSYTEYCFFFKKNWTCLCKINKVIL